MKNLIFTLLLVFGLNTLAAQSGVFMIVSGKVSIEKASGEVVKAKVSSVVHPGEAVITEADSKAKLVMSDRNVISILPNTKLVIKTYSNEPNEKTVDLKLDKGRIRTAVEQKYDGKTSKFQIQTGAMVLGVRGTEMVVSHNDSANTSEVVTITGEVFVQRVGTLSGALGFGKTGDVSVKAQERLQVSADSKSLKVETLKAKEFEALKKETAVEGESKEKARAAN